MAKKVKYEIQINHLVFLLFWVVFMAGFATISHNLSFMAWIEQRAGTEFIREYLWHITLLDTLLLAAFTAPIEKILLKLRFGHWLKGWISSRFLSLVLGVMPYILPQNFGLQSLVMNNPQNILQLSFFALITALPQVWILRRYVQNSWQYILGAIANSLIPVFLVSSLAGTTFGASFTIGLSSAVMALTMLWLFSHPVSEEKVKREEAESHVRLEDTLVDTEVEFEEHKQVYENHLD